MKLSKQTFDILKNFATICPSISIERGNVLRTISEQDNIVAYATVEEYFPMDFSIYDLNQFLGGLSIMKDSELNFENNDYVLIRSGNMSMKYFFTNKSFVKEAPQSINFPIPDLTFKITEQNLSAISRARAIYQIDDLSIIANDGLIHLVACNKKSDTSNNFSICVGHVESDQNLRLDLKTENIKVLSGDYIVSVSSQLISKFESTSNNLVYYVALEK